MVCWSGVIIINMAVKADRHCRCCSYFSCATGQGDFFIQTLWITTSPSCSLNATSFFPCLLLLLFHTNQSYYFILFFSCSCSLKDSCRIKYISLGLSLKGEQLVSWAVWSLNKKPLMLLKSSMEIRFSCLTKICLSFLVWHKMCESFCTILLSSFTVCRQETIFSLL